MSLIYSFHGYLHSLVVMGNKTVFLSEDTQDVQRTASMHSKPLAHFNSIYLLTCLRVKFFDCVLPQSHKYT